MLLVFAPMAQGVAPSGETLAAGDLTTAYAIWLRGVAPDWNTHTRDRLATNYSAPPNSDLTTLLARFLHDRQ